MEPQKVVFTTLNTDDADKDLQPGEYRLPARNILVYSDNRSGVRRKNVPGTLSLAEFQVSNLATCIGAEYDSPTDKSYFFFHDPDFGHSIIEYNVAADITTLLVRNMAFNFTLAKPIVDIFVIDDILYFNDQVYARKINITRAKAGIYNGSAFSEIAISQIRRQPILPPTGLRATDPLKTVLNPVIRRLSLQFALRYIYLDGEISVISPISRIFAPSRNEAQTNADNMILLTLHIDRDVKPFLETVELVARIGNTGNWYVADKILPTLFSTIANDPVTGFQRYSLQYNFYNDKAGPVLSDSEADPFFQSFPRRTDAQEVVDDKIFTVDSLAGEYDLEEDQWEASISLTHVTTVASLKALVNDLKPQPDYLLGLSRYGGCLFFFDKDGRRSAASTRPGLSLVTPANTTVLNYPGLGSNPEVISSQMSAISASILPTGKPPSWAYWVAPGRTRNLNYLWWHAAKCRVQIPRSTKKTELTTPSSSAFYLENGYEYYDIAKHYLDEAVSGAVLPPSGFGSILDITVPPDFPFAIDDKVLVQLAFDVKKIGGGFVNFPGLAPVLEIVNGKIRIRVANPSLIDWRQIFGNASGPGYQGVKLGPGTGPTNTPYGLLQNADLHIHVLLFRPYDAGQAPEVYYEVGELQPIVNPTAVNRAFNGPLPIRGDCYAQGYTFFEEPTPGHTVEFAKSGTDDQQRVMFMCMSALADKKRLAFLDAVQTDQGKPTTTIDDTKEVENGHIVRWSTDIGEYIEGNKVELARERGRVVRLVATSDNTILAVRPRAMDVLYINQRLLKQPSGQDTIVASDETVGYVRPLAGDIGTVNPESIVCVDGYRVYGFDFNAAEPWRKSLDGITRLATTFKTKKWFKAKCDLLKTAKAIDPTVDIKIIGGFDPYLEMFLLTFKEITYNDGGDVIVVPAETIGFSELAKGWVCNYGFTPEIYVNHSNSFLSVRNQELLTHNADPDNHNMFYGVQDSSMITVVANMLSDQEKQWDYLMQASNEPWAVTKAVTPKGQETDMPISIFERWGERFKVSFLRDVNTPASMVPPGKAARLQGVPLVSDTLRVTLQNSLKKEVVLDAVYLGFTPMLGYVITPR